MKYMLMFLFLIPVACEPAKPTEEVEVSCEMHYVGDRAIFQYSKDIPAPTGETCKNLGGGVYDCPQDFCNVVYYPGNCAECPGGGE